MLSGFIGTAALVCLVTKAVTMSHKCYRPTRKDKRLSWPADWLHTETLVSSCKCFNRFCRVVCYSSFYSDSKLTFL